MKRLLLLLLLFAPAAYPQGVSVAPQTATRNLGSQVVAMVGATVTVCAANAAGLPCSPALSNVVFKDTALTQPLTNPFFADNNGNYSFAIAPGFYTVTVTSFGQGYSYQLTVPSTPGGTPTGGVTSVSCNSVQNVFNCTVSNPTTTAAVTFSPITSGAVLDCTVFAGSDMGAKLNACLAALPAAGGVADATHFTSPQTLSTAVVNSIPAVIVCAGITITENANISLTGTGSSLVGAPGNPCTLNKGANIEQVTLGGSNNVVQNLTLNGERSGGVTGSGIHVNHGIVFPVIKNMTIESEAGDCINDLGGLAEAWDTIQCTDFGTSAVAMSGGAIVTEALNFYTSNGAADNSAAVFNISGVSTLNISESTMSPGGAFPVFSSNGGSSLRIVDTLVQNVSGRSEVSANGGNLWLAHDIFIGNGASGAPNILATGANTYIHDNELTAAGADSIDVSQTAGTLNIGNNVINIDATAGQAGIHVTTLMIAANIHANTINFATDTITADVYGIWLQAPVGSAQFSDSNITDNVINGNSLVHTVGLFWDNTNGDSNANVNIISHTQCFSTAVCIKRNDPSNLLNIYLEQVSNGTTAFSGGSTGDLITQEAGSFTFATLPTAGFGSHVYCSDCTRGTPLTGGGSGADLIYGSSAVNGTAGVNGFTANQSVVGQDTHTAEITGNYSAVTLIPSTYPTGSYLVTIYVEVSTGVATSTVTTSISYHDDTGAQTQSGSSLSGATTGTIQTLTFPVRFVTGTALTYSTSTANSPKYKIFARAQAQ